MKTYKKLQNILTMAVILLSFFAFGQEQKEYINYQAVARDASNEILVSQTIVIGISLRFGSPTATLLYTETHNTVTTDISGVFSLQIGNGTVVSGIYKDLKWGKLAPYATITLNGTDVGTVALQSVPYANASGKATRMEINDLTNVDGTPTDGQVLKFDGTDWTPATDETGTGSSTLWTENGDDIYYNTGKVGIGAFAGQSSRLSVKNVDPETRTGVTVEVTNTDINSMEGVRSLVELQSSGAGTGFFTKIYGAGTGSKTGFESDFTASGEGAQYGFKASFLASNPSAKYGFYVGGEDRNYFSGNVAIGSNDLTGKLSLMNSTNQDALKIIQDYSGSSSSSINIEMNGTGSGNIDKYGYVSTISNGNGIKTGINLHVKQDANTTATGIDNIISSSGSGNIYGLYNDLYHSGSGMTYGLYTNFGGLGSGDKYGLYMLDEDKNYFSGKVGLNTEEPHGRLHIKDGYSFGSRPFLELETNSGDRSDIRFSKTDQTDYWEIISGLRSDPSSATLSFYYIDGNPSTEDQILTLRGDGIIQYTGSLSDVSDRRLKENILKIESPLSKVLALNGYSYNMINDANKKMEYGVMAQEVQEVLPYAVNIIDEEKGYLGVSYLQLIPVLIEALKEQQQEIDSLKSDYHVLLSKIDRIETQLSSRANNSNDHTDSKP